MQQCTPQFNNLFRVSRGDNRKLLFGLALQHSEDRFAKFDVIGGFFLERSSEWRHIDVKYFVV
jgi:hypothetical protein